LPGALYTSGLRGERGRWAAACHHGLPGAPKVIEVDAGILASARVSVGLAFGLYTYFVFAAPIKALYARIRAKAKR
jgi:hypothetical protein